ALDGGAGDDYLNGGAGDDQILGAAGDDRLLGGAGRNTLVGGSGDDRYYLSSAVDRIVENTNEGYDMVVTNNVDVILPANVEALYMEGRANLLGRGNELDNALLGNDGNNILEGGYGDDVINGELGNDVVIGGAGDDVLAGGSDNDIGGNDVLLGGDGADAMYGNGGNDVLDGGAQGDYMVGGAGNDSFIFHAADMFTIDSPYPTPSLLDNAADFQGAGSDSPGDQDVLIFVGFGAGARLEFDHYGYTKDAQFYRVVDPTNPAHNALILIGMADGATAQLRASDYLFQ
ncbi:MAG TPA: calcium-binding protein, partial [Burkholderiaceae bacterium]